MELGMEIWKAALMGVVQGIAEFLPVSSSGHLAFMRQILNLDLEQGGLLFDVLLHLGTLIAIILAFWKDIKKLFVEGIGIVVDFFKNIGIWFRNRGAEEKEAYIKVVDSAYRKFVMLVIVATIPTGILGFFLQDVVRMAGTTLLIPGICLIVTSLLLFVSDHYNQGIKRPNQISYVEGFLTGTAQGIATMPGLSRSGTTIAVSLLCGFEKNFAVRYSFIMSIPTVLGAVVLELKDFSEIKFVGQDILAYVVGTLIAGIVGFICIKMMLSFIRKRKLWGFSIYCLVIGAFSVIWYFLH